MKRRDFVKTTGAGTLAGLASLSALGSTLAFAAGEHDHSKDEKPVKRRAMSKELKALVDAAYDCLQKADTCLAQCQAVLESGKTSMAACQASVMNMIAVCDAMARTGTYNSTDSKRLKALAKVCADFCRDCEKECEKHAEHHVECKECLESCRTCAKACDAYVKA